jgi:stearoyl-CoA desaturase (delta-9 desaturase)
VKGAPTSAEPTRPVTASSFTTLTRWIDSWAGMDELRALRTPVAEQRVDWLRVAPFLALHLSAVAVVWVGWSWTALGIAAALYVVRMFAITAFYHRYFSHRAFKTSRAAQFVFGLLGATSVQRGPLWWAAHHREHHRSSDTADDPHSPLTRGFWWSHVGWITARENFATRLEHVKDLAKFPELRFLDRFDILTPVAFFAALYGLGALLESYAPGLGTNGWQLVVWGGVISTVVLFHATFTINSLAHVWGKRVYPTSDTSRNNLWLALLTLGEGWHNNHHYYPGAARQGFTRWQIDPSYYALKVLEKLGLVWDLRPVPQHILERGARREGV